MFLQNKPLPLRALIPTDGKEPKPAYSPELFWSVAKSLKSVRPGQCRERARNCETVPAVEIVLALPNGRERSHEVITMATAKVLRDQLNAILND